MAQMTKDVLIESCKKNGGYSQPRLNDQLFLQYKGFTRIMNLEEYTDLKVLWLEQNAIENIEGLDTLSNLVSLFLQNNVIRKISGLEGVTNLRILNLSNNFITKLDNLSCLPLLETLQVSHCRLSSLGDISEASKLPELSTLDVSFNQIERREGVDDQNTCVVDFFKEFPSLSVLYLHGNEIVRSLKDYRKSMIVGMPKLNYLDERPVFPDERRTTEAWGRGGREAEDEERTKIRDEKRAHLTSCVDDMVRLKEATKEKREKAEREWRELQDAKQQWSNDQRLEYTRLFNELDADEYEGRGQTEIEEEEQWAHVSSVAGKGLYDLERMNRQEIEEAAARAAAEKELRQVEEEMAAKAKKERMSKEQEMEFWIKRFTEQDTMLEEELQNDLDGYLNALNPGEQGPSAAALLKMPESDPSYHRAASGKPKALNSTSSTTSTAAPVTTTTSTTPSTAATAASSQQKKKGKSDIWEKYYAFEKAAERRHQQKA